MRQEVHVYVTIKLKGFWVRDLKKVMRATGRWGLVLFIVVNAIKYRYGRPQITTGQMGFGVVHCCYYDKIYL